MDREPRDISRWKGIIDKWYLKRFRAAMEWENLMAKDHGLNAIVKSDTRSLSFRTISPLVFFPSFHKKENFVISVKSRDFEVPPVTIEFKSEPMIYMCLCKFYNEKYAIVTVSRDLPGYDTRLYGIQLDKGTFMLPNCSSVPVPNAGDYIYGRINKRTAQVKHRMSVHGVSAETYQLKDFCKGDHPMSVEIFKQFCPQCNGHIGCVPGLRKCECTGLPDTPASDVDTYVNQGLIMPLDWEPFKVESG
jgi:hypothetical protein